MTDGEEMMREDLQELDRILGRKKKEENDEKLQHRFEKLNRLERATAS